MHADAEADLVRFSTWVENFFQPAGADLAEGERLARQRQRLMEKLIRTNPKRALEWAVTRSARRRLPEQITRHLEEPVSGRGFFGVLLADDFENNRRDVRREVVLGGKRYDAFVYGRRSSQVTTPNASLHGLAIGDFMAVHESPVRQLEAEEPVSSDALDRPCFVSSRPVRTYATPALGEIGGKIESFCSPRHLELFSAKLAADSGGTTGNSGELPTAPDSWSQGPKTCLFMRVSFPDDPAEPISEDGAYALMDGVNQWFVENSYQTASIVPAVTPLLMLPHPKSWYGAQGTGRLLADAREAARLSGYETDNYDFDMVRHRQVPGFNFNGLGYVRGKGAWLQSSSVGVACHELGHNFGLWHANSWSASGDSVIGPGMHVEYGNNFDTMGAASAGNHHFNAAFKNQLDWLPDAAVVRVTTNGVYRVYAFDGSALAPRRHYALMVKKNYDRNYWAEFRQKFNNRWLLNGVILNWDAWNNGVTDSGGGTHLLDTTPGTPDDKNDSAVVVGRTFSDLSAGVHLTPVSKGGFAEASWIDVDVRVGEFTGNRPPMANLVADAMSVAPGVAVNFFAGATDDDGDALAFYWDFGDGSLGPNANSATKVWSQVGEYVVRCLVSDGKGGAASRHAVITVGAPATFRLSGRVTDDDGLPVEGVRVHNGQNGPDYRGAYSDSDGQWILVNIGPGSHALSAVKYGYTLTPSGWANPVSVGPNVAGLNWAAAAAPRVRLAATDPVASEAGIDRGRFTIFRTGPTNTMLTVKLNRSGTASFSIDYTNGVALSGAPLQLAIPPGAASLEISVNPLPDALSEGPEFVTLTLIEDASYVFDGLAEATVVISDDETPTLPQVFVAASGAGGLADNLAPESGSDSGVFTFTRMGSTAGELAVFYTVSGTAVAETDYASLAGVVTIPAGEAVTTVPFRVIDDVEVENAETVIVTIRTNAAYAVSGGAATVTILDDDPPTVSVTATDEVAKESDLARGAFTITRQGGLAANLVVHYTVGGTATSGLDFDALSGSVTILAGRATATIILTPVNDALLEPEEVVTVTLRSSPSYNIGQSGVATVLIVDDESPGVRVAATDDAARETGLDPGVFTFTRTGDLSSALAVYFRLNGTAVADADYDHVSSPVVFPAGSAVTTLMIRPRDDSLREIPETVHLVIEPGPNYSVNTPEPQTVMLYDNDAGLPGVGFDTAFSSGSESRTPMQLSVSLSTNSATTVSVNYAVTGGSATGNGVDYVLAAGTLRFTSGRVSETISLFVNNDSQIEPNETVLVSLSNPVNAALDAIATHTFTILDDDGSGTVSISAVDADASETGPEPGVLRISRNGPVTNALTVLFETLGGASSPADYAFLGRSVTLPAGSNAVDLVVQPVDDATPETNEAVTVRLLPSPGVKFGNERATVFIADNDDGSVLPIVTIAASDSVASEPGVDTGLFTISRDRGTNEALAVRFTVAGTAASGADYVGLGTMATIPVGALTTTITVTPKDDLVFETDETVTVTLTILEAYRVGAAASASILLTDDEPGVSVTARGASSEDGSLTGTFTVTRSGSLSSNLVVQLASAGTATPGVDYESLPSLVEIPAGTNAIELPVRAMDDASPEGNETVVLTLANGSGYTVSAPDSATVLIVDDEPSVSVAASDELAYEGGGNEAAFLITRTGRTDAPLVVHLSFGGTASNGLDYATISNAVVVPAGEASRQLAVVPLDDQLVEGNEIVEITLQPDPAYALTSVATARATIVDDEVNLVPVVQIVNPSTDLVFLASTDSVLLLEASANDDGRPLLPGTLTLAWSQVRGPGVVTFSDSGSGRSTVRFSTNGLYVLRWSAWDGELEGTVELRVVVDGMQSLNAGLEAHWRFDETDGPTSYDASGQGRDAAVNGARFASGRFGNAIDLDGLDDFASFASPPLPQLTVSAWIRSDSAGASATPRVLAMPGYNLRVRRQPGAGEESLSFEAERQITAGDWRTPGGLINDGFWHHIAVAYDNGSIGNAPALYVDGVLQSATRLDPPAGAALDNEGIGYIGNSAELDRGWDGRIDEMLVFNRVLSADEIALLALGPLTNLAPVVEAGASQTIPLSGQAMLDGSVLDDWNPNPPGMLDVRWSKWSGPGAVTFSDSADLQSPVTFSEGGIYVLRLTATDGQVSIIDDVVVTVISPTIIGLAATRNAQEFGGQGPFQGPSAGWFVLSRNGNVSAPLTVNLLLSGTAANGVDYVALGNEVAIPAAATLWPVLIQPIADALGEGEETVTLSVQPDPAYLIDNPGTATVIIEDAPWDEWRFTRFTTLELEDSMISGTHADPDSDGKRNLYEYSINTDPRMPEAATGLSGALSVSPGSEAAEWIVSFTRRRDPTDVVSQLEVSEDLRNWHSGPDYFEELRPTQIAADGLTEIVRAVLIPASVPSEGRFVRVKVSLIGAPVP